MSVLSDYSLTTTQYYYSTITTESVIFVVVVFVYVLFIYYYLLIHLFIFYSIYFIYLFIYFIYLFIYIYFFLGGGGGFRLFSYCHSILPLHHYYRILDYICFIPNVTDIIATMHNILLHFVDGTSCFSEGVFWLYRLSYNYIGTAGFIVTIFVAFVVSFLTGESIVNSKSASHDN